MALPMLVTGAECGPVNPLQGLAKRLDQDRGLQQDYFGASGAGSSKEAFRSQQAAAPGFQQDAARFFSEARSPVPSFPGASSFDMSALRVSIPPVQTRPMQTIPGPSSAGVDWAADFMQIMPGPSSSRQERKIAAPVPSAQTQAHQQPSSLGPLQHQPPLGVMNQPNPLWSAPVQAHIMSPMPFAPAQISHAQEERQITQHDAAKWEKAFLTQFHRGDFIPDSQISSEPTTSQPETQNAAVEQDELARTAGRLIEAISHEQNPKFKNSQFLGMMRQLRDREMVVEGNQMVEADPAGVLTTGAEVKVDLKGKGRAEPNTLASVQMTGRWKEPGEPIVGSEILTESPFQVLTNALAQVTEKTSAENAASAESREEDPNDAYFRQENEEYANFMNEMYADHYEATASGSTSTSAQQAEWGHLQESWDRFEATSVGIRRMSQYTFTANNPYVLGEASRTRHHMMHTKDLTHYQNVLEMEAAVQRDPNNARAWYELGVKQQENEREAKAIAALQRSLELDPEHLPSWLALAISYTNEGNRMGSFHAIREWVGRNKTYEGAVREHRSLRSEAEVDGAGQSERVKDLVDCLITMARSRAGSELDADIQIALAVLLNNHEDYAKSRDCFRAALEVRPEDWQLWNRVGATLANSGNAEEALHYYTQALELNPVYIRARYNVGIALINLRRYEEAAQHFLDALALQESESVRDANGVDDKRGVTSDSLWDSLKTSCIHMQRPDMATMCDTRNLEGVFLVLQALERRFSDVLGLSRRHSHPVGAGNTRGINTSTSGRIYSTHCKPRIHGGYSDRRSDHILHVDPGYGHNPSR
ncbi:hypothetical protein PUNSTDRAFT_63530 [Punctularia strigosozonata HHB-11173 SS5]|uniref:uncharacterized protein n=1 Tax=Punctularia strigosozonata (strain HHB-11173) TaxID=741275 RepID=UPI0004416F21|nr:uncharacterized protein PUNSTDRAFT_63530 [Punctularia strigosozonata HHB-11173 SS5]EIN11880.1 hypothetical protein PUNSTDRAFT_63530 [Punctularia strigosozonata HHB-11173 SS5]